MIALLPSGEVPNDDTENASVDVVDVKSLQESVLSRKDTGLDMLTEPLVHTYLSSVYKNATKMVEDSAIMGGGSGGGKNEEEGDERRAALSELRRRIEEYNRRNSYQYAVKLHQDLKYEGLMKFYIESNRKLTTRSLRVFSNMTVGTLLPLLSSNFGLHVKPKKRLVLYQTYGSDEILLADEEHPLEVAITSARNVRFLLKIAESTLDFTMDGSCGGHHKTLTSFFGVQPKELTAPYSTGMSPILDSRGGSWELLSLTSNSSSMNSLTESTGKGKKSPILMQNKTGGNALWLRPKTPTFRRKQVKKCDDDLKDRNDKMVKSKKGKSRLTNLLGSSFSHKKWIDLKASRSEEDRTEDKVEKGLFKVHANFANSECKCRKVFVSEKSTADDVVRDFLDLSSVSYDSYTEFVLCDVVGQYRSGLDDMDFNLNNNAFSSKWVETSSRVLQSDDIPLEIQAFWLPRHKLSRRFEIRRKEELKDFKNASNLSFFDLVNGDIDSISSSESNLRNGYDNHPYHGQRDEAFEFVRSASFDSPRSQLYRLGTIQTSPCEREETESSDENAPVVNIHSPQNAPYLLCIQGFSAEKDLVFHVLNKEVLIIGNHLSARAEGKGFEPTDITLHGPDISLHHCILTRKQNHNPEVSIANSDAFSALIEPCEGARLAVNHQDIHQETLLKSGDLITIGNYYHFIYKDPLLRNSWRLHFPWMNDPRHDPESTFIAASPYLAERAHFYLQDPKRWKIRLQSEDQDDFFEWLACLISDEDSSCSGLAVAHVFVMCLEFTAYNYSQADAKDVLLRIATVLQRTAYDKAKEMASKHSNESSNVRPSMKTLLPDLKLLLLCLSNSLEFLNYLQANLPDYLAACHMTNDDSSKSIAPSMYGPEAEEAFSLLEEVVMYTFQQCVYYLTKTLYDALPTIFNSNPFVEDDEGGTCSSVPSVKEVTNIFDTTFDLLKDARVHYDITSQLFAYLLFFMNAALFNTLIEKGSSGKWLKWSRGVQIRGNLDVVESWIHNKSLEGHLHFIQKISSAADLLATPKPQLIQATWSSLRRDYSLIIPAQLHQLLTLYDLGPSAHPQSWTPPQDESGIATNRDILECFDDHPPLTLPNGPAKLNVNMDGEIPGVQALSKKLQQAIKSIVIYKGSPPTPSAEQNTASIPKRVFKRERDHKKLSRQRRLSCPIPCGDSYLSLKTESDESSLKSEQTFREYSQKLQLQNNLSDMKQGQEGSKVKGERKKDACLRKKDEGPQNRKNRKQKSTAMHDGKSGNKPDFPKVKMTHSKSDKELLEKIIYTKPLEAEMLNHVESAPSTKSADPSPPLNEDMVKRMEKANLIQSYFEKSSNGGFFDSIPEEDDSSSLEDFSLPDDVRPLSSSIDDDSSETVLRPPSAFQGNDDDFDKINQSDEMFHDNAVAEFDPVEFAVGGNCSSDVCQKPSKIKAEPKGRTDYSVAVSKPNLKHRRSKTSLDDVFMVDLDPSECGLGISFIDGMKVKQLLELLLNEDTGIWTRESEGQVPQNEKENQFWEQLPRTALSAPGVYVYQISSSSTAALNGRLRIGDRLLAVNGTSLVGAGYEKAMEMISQPTEQYRFLVAKSDPSVGTRIRASVTQI